MAQNYSFFEFSCRSEHCVWAFEDILEDFVVAISDFWRFFWIFWDQYMKWKNLCCEFQASFRDSWQSIYHNWVLFKILNDSSRWIYYYRYNSSDPIDCCLTSINSYWRFFEILKSYFGIFLKIFSIDPIPIFFFLLFLLLLILFRDIL